MKCENRNHVPEEAQHLIDHIIGYFNFLDNVCITFANDKFHRIGSSHNPGSFTLCLKHHPYTDNQWFRDLFSDYLAYEFVVSISSRTIQSIQKYDEVGFCWSLAHELRHVEQMMGNPTFCKMNLFLSVTAIPDTVDADWPAEIDSDLAAWRILLRILPDKQDKIDRHARSMRPTKHIIPEYHQKKRYDVIKETIELWKLFERTARQEPALREISDIEARAI